MKVFITLASLFAAANAGVILGAVRPITNTGLVSGPVHPAAGDLVATRRGLRPISLEGFSEDDNQDGFVDPIGQAVVAAPVALPAIAPAVYSQPIISAPVVAAAPSAIVKSADAAVIKTVEAPVLKTVAAPAFATVAHAPIAAYSTGPIAHTVVSSPVISTPYAAAPVAVAAGPRLAQHALLTPGLTINGLNALYPNTVAIAAEPVAEEAAVVAEE